MVQCNSCIATYAEGFRMLTTGDGPAAFSVQGVRPRIGDVSLKAGLTAPVGQPRATKWQAAFSWTGDRTFAAGSHAGVRSMSAGLSLARNLRKAVRAPDALQGGALCPRDMPQGDEHLKGA